MLLPLRINLEKKPSYGTIGTGEATRGKRDWRSDEEIRRARERFGIDTRKAEIIVGIAAKTGIPQVDLDRELEDALDQIDVRAEKKFLDILRVERARLRDLEQQKRADEEMLMLMLLAASV